MRNTKKCLLFLGLISIMGAIRSNDVVSTLNQKDREIIKEEIKAVVRGLKHEKEAKKEERTTEIVRTTIYGLAIIGFAVVAVLFMQTGFYVYDFFQELSKNAA